MATKASIIQEINAKIRNTGFGNWRIGLTHAPDERKTYWKDTEKEHVNYWSQWAADSLSDAQDIESHFINKGMKGGTGGNLSDQLTVYVYVF